VSARWKRWMRRGLLLASAAVLVAAVLIETGVIERQMRRTTIRQLEQKTGARVEMGGFHLHLWRLHVEIEDLTLHGLEDANMPPLFHAARMDVRIRVISWLGRKFALDELIVEGPQVVVNVDKNGHSNVPTPATRAS